ncbi:MAG: flagellin [Lachnospiraceae bacterium]|nr:flagellin [Lachnospiraceae bacterium]
MVVAHNLNAMNSSRMLGLTTSAQAKSTEKLSSGYKINRAADDAAGLSISEKMRKQIRGLTQASANAQDGISMVQTAEGALGEVQDMLQRMNELAVKAANGSLSTNDNNDVQRELNQLRSEIDRVSTTTKFNETYLLNGQGTQTSNVTKTSQVIKLHVGADSYDDNKISITLSGMNASLLGIDKDALTVSAATTDEAHTKATGVISTVEAALKKVSKQRSELGAAQNRLEHTIKNLDNVVENTTAAESEIRDTDMAAEMVTYSKNNILAQAGQSMLAQANQSNQGVLSLLG